MARESNRQQGCLFDAGKPVEPVLVQRELELWPLGVSELYRTSYRKSRGIVPRRFIALLPIPEREEREEGRVDPRPWLPSWPLGRRSACPSLRLRLSLTAVIHVAAKRTSTSIH
jgi:hypothetical protein